MADGGAAELSGAAEEANPNIAACGSRTQRFKRVRLAKAQEASHAEHGGAIES